MSRRKHSMIRTQQIRGHLTSRCRPSGGGRMANPYPHTDAQYEKLESLVTTEIAMRPTTAMPGSPEKIAILAVRYNECEDGFLDGVFLPGDAEGSL